MTKMEILDLKTMGVVDPRRTPFEFPHRFKWVLVIDNNTCKNYCRCHITMYRILNEMVDMGHEALEDIGASPFKEYHSQENVRRGGLTLIGESSKKIYHGRLS